MTDINKRRVVRGGCFGVGPWDVRSATRSWFRSGNRFDFLGFRIVAHERPPSSVLHRVVRGGSFGIEPWLVRSAIRLRVRPEYRFVNQGFRLASHEPKVGEEPRMLRGGAFNDSAGFLRTTFRNRGGPEHRFRDVGFRYVSRDPSCIGDQEHAILAKEAIKIFRETRTCEGFIESMLSRDSRFSRFSLMVLWIVLNNVLANK